MIAVITTIPAWLPNALGFVAGGVAAALSYCLLLRLWGKK